MSSKFADLEGHNSDAQLANPTLSDVEMLMEDLPPPRKMSLVRPTPKKLAERGMFHANGLFKFT